MIWLILSTALINNFVLYQFLGLCPFIGGTRNLAHSAGLALATGAVLICANLACFALYYGLLVPFELTFLRTLVFVLTVAALVQSVRLMMQYYLPLLHRILGIYLPLITTNCAVLGVILINLHQQHSFREALGYSFGAASGFALVLILFAAMRERLQRAPISSFFQGIPIALISGGIMSLAFMGFRGLSF